MNKKISELAALGEVPQLNPQLNSYANYDNGTMPDYRKVFTMKFLEVLKKCRER